MSAAGLAEVKLTGTILRVETAAVAAGRSWPYCIPSAMIRSRGREVAESPSIPYLDADREPISASKHTPFDYARPNQRWTRRTRWLAPARRAAVPDFILGGLWSCAGSALAWRVDHSFRDAGAGIGPRPGTIAEN